MKSITALENSLEPIDRANLAVIDANAWVHAANARLSKANRILSEINAERAKADPPLAAIPSIAPIEPIKPIEAPADPGPSRG
jgi:hypothetical protein